MIPYGKHHIDQDDIQAVVDVLQSGCLTQGPAITVFEKSFANYVGAKYAVAVSSCTAGLHLSVLAAGLEEGDELVTTPITFVSSANCGTYVGAKVVFADIDPSTINMSPVALLDNLKKHSKIKVAIPVHFAGLPCDMKTIKDHCDNYGVSVIEDAAHALGAIYDNGKKVGSCCYSLMTIFSLHPVKAIAAGEGGVVTTNDYGTYKKLLRLRSHGINKESDIYEFPDHAFTNDLSNPWYYEMQDLGYHYRITDIQCALANSQLRKLDKFISKRREIARLYYESISENQHIKFAQPRSMLHSSAYHLFVVCIDFKSIHIDRAMLMHQLRGLNILTQVHYIPVQIHPYYAKLSENPDDCIHALNYYSECLSLPIYFDLSLKDQMYVVNSLTKLLK